MIVTNSKDTFMEQSVKAFWQGVNWENRPNFGVQAQVIQSKSFSMTLNVRDYFGMIPWSGVAIATSIPKPSLPQNTDKSETLEDFLDDISRFF